MQYVNPFIGTGGHGHTYPGATLPHGMVQLSPDTRLDGWDGCGGYHYSDSFVYGFSHTHLSGTGVSDYGDILVMPFSGSPSPDSKVYGSRFSHTKEKASAGYYSVYLEDDKIKAELTTTERVGFHHYTFSPGSKSYILLDLRHRDEVIESSILIEDSVTVTGMRRSRGWAVNQYVFFVMKFSSPFVRNGLWDNENLIVDTKVLTSRNIKAFFNFDLPVAKELFVKVAISTVSVEGAKRNLVSELPGWDFAATKNKAEKKWNDELSKIEVEGSDPDKLKIFYTALYHTAVVPNINMDVDSMYRGRDDKIHKAKDFTNYSVFSLWDTYRAAHPLYVIIDRKRSLDYIKTFLAQYEQGGRLPVWELSSNETDCMIGYHSVPVITDAYVKGIRDFDTRLALEAMKKSANWDHLGLPAYRSKGMIETDDEHESVSKMLEYAYDDFCIALFASNTGNKDDYVTFIKRAQYYKNILDPETGFMRPRKNGDWIKPFDPREVNNHFTEANSWQYSFYFPQDIGGYLKMRGGIKKLEEHLDNLFSAPSETTGRDQSDITGLIGQYAHGNEPSHHIAYLYNYTSKPFKTQEKVHQVMSTMYKNTPDGLIGNEDCGQMSAWYVFSALGFYPVIPGTSNYVMGTPAFHSMNINLENGKTFEIKAHDLSDSNYYVQKASLYINNDKEDFFKTFSYLQHANIVSGGKMDFKMGNKPSTFFSLGYPKSEISDSERSIKIVLNPIIHGGGVAFKGSKNVKITSELSTSIYYTTDGSSPTEASSVYVKPLLVNRSLTLKAIAIDSENNKSFITTAQYKKLPHNWSVKINTPFEKQYDAGGADGLVDGIKGNIDWRKGYWQGYQVNGADVIIDLTKIMRISEVHAGFLQDTKAWIVMPGSVSVEVSSDNKNFIPVYNGKDFLNVENLEPQIKIVQARFQPVSARYVRIRASQYGKLPAWHEGAGGDTHIFMDEIEIK